MKFGLIAALFVVLATLVNAYNIGVGIWDMTGPAVEINFMGYGAPDQRGTGIHQRLRSRAYAISDGNSNICFVSIDGGMGSDWMKNKILAAINAELGENTYTSETLSISGTHTHAGPAGFLQYTMFQVTSLGSVPDTISAWVTGISQSVIMAHRSRAPGKILMTQGRLEGANINRSPSSYLLNPESERAEYAQDGDTDKTMLNLKFVSDSGANLGILNWFAVHGTSMNNTNTLISGDNRGYASYALEKEVNGPDSTPGMGPFVAAFASTNLGDVSPNTAGPKCIDTGLPCDLVHSTCNGRNELCIAFGPGTNGDMFESTKIIGDKQYRLARELMNDDSKAVLIDGPVSARHSFVDMHTLNVKLSDGTNSTLCSSALGYSFAAGTTDGPGMFDFTQGTTSGNPFWDQVAAFLAKPTEEEIQCQAPKPILINTADIVHPYRWEPRTLPMQIFRVGQLFILSVPSEFTTMAGRRMRKAMSEVVKASGILPAGQEPIITIAGLSNSYSHYTTTWEEYQGQRYEAASTLYGPNQLSAYIQEYTRIMGDLIADRPSQSAEPPEDMDAQQIQLIPMPFFDYNFQNLSFGTVIEGRDANPSYVFGESVQVSFVAANPRNNQRLQGTFLTVQKQKTAGKVPTYQTVAVDGDWETKFQWHGGLKPNAAILPNSTASITWDIPTEGVSEGIYRICHQGDHKLPKVGTILPYQGCSSLFTVSAPQTREKELKKALAESSNEELAHLRKKRTTVVE